MPIMFDKKDLQNVAKHIRTSFLNSQTRIRNEYLLLESIIDRLEEDTEAHGLAVDIYNKHGELLKIMDSNLQEVGVIINEEV